MSLSGNSNDRPSIPYQALGSDRVDNSKAKGIQRGHNAMVFLVTIFIISSTFFSIIPVRSTKSKPAIPPLYSDGIDAKFMSAGSSMRALTWAERNDRTWSDAKCQKEFPLLYPQLEQVTQYWKERGGLNKSVIDMNEEHVKPNDGTGYVRVIIRDGQLFIRSFHEGPETRNSALIHHLSQVVASWPSSSQSGSGKKDDRLPPIDLILSPGDKDTFAGGGGWTVTKRPDDASQNGTWLIAGAASYEEFIELAAEVEEEYPWDKKHDRMFWRGFANWYPVRRDLIERTSTTIYPERESWSDVHETTFHPGPDASNFYPLVSLPDHCQHKYLIHTEGNSYSGRSKYLFSCQSITVAHPLEWTQHFHPALNPNPDSPNQNFIQLFGPAFDGLEEAAMELRRGDTDRWYGTKKSTYTGTKTPKVIAENAKRTLRDRYLSPAATACYTRAALRHYADSLNTASWGPKGPQLLAGQGVAPDASKGHPMAHLKGDIEAGVWRLLGGPNWPPGPDPIVGPVEVPVVVPDQKIKAAIVGR